MRQRVEFRTPQHPSLGTNNWGGASPLLARNIPKESLESKYARLNSARTSHEIFPAHDHHFNDLFPDNASEHEHDAATATRGILFNLLFKRKEKTAVVLGSNSKKRRWFPRLNPQNRWPNGWC
ncbi:hypothetical protein L6164_034436 [Bauhinia variegata]|uniref:Uncharacterized protein n=1 Tax=Bauhinia variegata TaxID=167791 RepID=A0ACB9KUV4_BAUVA|nr:hypothetical protein L6164_034436 [Bauhinia variegata]